jgi:predicted transcriptional regulator
MAGSRKKHSTPRLTSGELELLSVLWQRGPCTIAEAHAAFKERVGYTTVQTRLNRLAAKGVVAKSDERPAKYRATLAPDDVSRGDLETLVRRVSSGQVVPLVAHLVRDRDLSKEEIEELRQLIDEAEQQAKPTKSRGTRRNKEPKQ